MSKVKRDTRQLTYEACAKKLQWTLRPKDDTGMLKWLLDFQLFKRGGRKTFSPMMIQHHGDLEFTCVFDYAYTVSSGKTTVTFRQTVYFKYSKALALPHFIMVPEKWFHRIGTYFGMQDIDFVEYPVFSQNYLLRGEDEDYIRHHFDHPEMIRYFDKQKFYSLEGMNYLMVLYVHNVVMPQQQIMQLVTIGNSLHNFFADKTPGIDLPEDGTEYDMPPLPASD